MKTQFAQKLSTRLIVLLLAAQLLLQLAPLLRSSNPADITPVRDSGYGLMQFAEDCGDTAC